MYGQRGVGGVAVGGRREGHEGHGIGTPPGNSPGSGIQPFTQRFTAIPPFNHRS